MNRAFLLCFVLGTPALSAQQPSLIGTWKLSYPAGMRIEGGVAMPLMATGVLTVAAAGDSLIGTLATDPSPDVPARPPSHLAAPATSGGEAVFVAHSQATLNINGEERKAAMVSTWKLAVRGDSLVGSVERYIEGAEMGDGGPQPVTGVRAGN